MLMLFSTFDLNQLSQGAVRLLGSIVKHGSSVMSRFFKRWPWKKEGLRYFLEESLPNVSLPSEKKIKLYQHSDILCLICQQRQTCAHHSSLFSPLIHPPKNCTALITNAILPKAASPKQAIILKANGNINLVAHWWQLIKLLKALGSNQFRLNKSSTSHCFFSSGQFSEKIQLWQWVTIHQFI